MRAVPAALLGLMLVSCSSTQAVWQRLDGQSVHSSPALLQQAEVDMATCRAVAVNAGNAVPLAQAPTRISVDNSITIAGGSVQSPSAGADFSQLGDIGIALGNRARVSQTQNANFAACMAQRGYRLVEVPKS